MLAFGTTCTFTFLTTWYVGSKSFRPAENQEREPEEQCRSGAWFSNHCGAVRRRRAKGFRSSQLDDTDSGTCCRFDLWVQSLCGLTYTEFLLGPQRYLFWQKACLLAFMPDAIHLLSLGGCREFLQQSSGIANCWSVRWGHHRSLRSSYCKCKSPQYRHLHRKK